MKNRSKSHLDNLEAWIPQEKLNAPIRRWLKEYKAGRRIKKLPTEVFDFAEGTPFQIKVWKTLLKIPYGEVRSYKWICDQLGLKGGARAVGQANKRNPYPIVIPCHRVIASDGSLGGYAYGLEMKKKLLEHEGIVIPAT